MVWKFWLVCGCVSARGTCMVACIFKKSWSWFVEKLNGLHHFFFWHFFKSSSTWRFIHALILINNGHFRIIINLDMLVVECVKYIGTLPWIILLRLFSKSFLTCNINNWWFIYNRMFLSFKAIIWFILLLLSPQHFFIIVMEWVWESFCYAFVFKSLSVFLWVCFHSFIIAKCCIYYVLSNIYYFWKSTGCSCLCCAHVFKLILRF